VRELSELTNRNIVVYDSEIIRSIGDDVEGRKVTWNDHDLMGISVACAFDYEDGDYKVFMQDNLPELAERLNRAELVVAFNQIGFDNKLLRASGLPLNPDEQLRNYDMLVESRKALGWKVGSNSYPRGCKLDDHLSAIFGKTMLKTANGEEAPRMYQRGEMGKLISYCLADVRREKALFEHIWLHGWVKTPTNGTKTVKHPIEFLNWPKPAIKGLPVEQVIVDEALPEQPEFEGVPV
jgi:DEAD/DEAH box helicase domain-containing protein